MIEVLRRDGAIALLLAVLALLPFGPAAELPVLVAALLGVVGVARGRIDITTPASRLAILLFVAYWLPELLSALDSQAPTRSWTEVAADLRFLPFLLFATRALDEADKVRRLFVGVALILSLWLLDALVQAATGWSLGGSDGGDRLSGIFGEDNLKLGGVVAALAPFLLLAATHRFGYLGGMVAFVPLLLVVLLAGARAGWIVFALATALVLWQHAGLRRGGLVLLLAAVLATLAGAAAQLASPRFAERVERTATALSGDAAAIDHALAGRLPIWRTALQMSRAHPVNGVGVRAFRYAYPEHAAPGDPWVDVEHGVGALHAHQLVLEVASETGLAGLLCWMLGAVLAIRAWCRADAAARARAAAPAIALASTLFPLNTHYAVYSSFWSLLLFALLACALAALHARGTDQSTP